MPRPERGRTATGFRVQLLARLRNAAAQQGVTVDRLQQRVAFERLLARLTGRGDWVLKGGFALELRYGWGNRPTRDIDLRTDLGPAEAVDCLRSALAASTIADHFSFELGEVTQEMQGAPGGGMRVRLVARVGGTEFARFSIDLASGDALVGPPDEMRGSDLLGFAGIEPVRFPVYPIAQHLAEKLHAYSLPRNTENTRVKDLVDMITIVAWDAIDGDALLASVHATFQARGTHPPPDSLPEPPSTWAVPFTRLARETAAAPTTDLREGFALAAQFWNPVSLGVPEGQKWLPTERGWRPQPPR